MTSAPPEVSPLRGDEVTAASALLAAALAEDPGWVHVVPDPGRRRAALTTLTGVALRDALCFGSVLAARDISRLSGVAVWLPPGCYPMSARRKLHAAPALTALALRAPGDFRALTALGAGIDAAFPSEPVWYLQILGVRPDMQRRGLGRRLMEPVLTEADRSGVPCYLETGQPTNAVYYEGVGFAVTGAIVPLYPGGPPMARMIRPAGTV
jgi:GNAT superfamily N-acetyltransferase